MKKIERMLNIIFEFIKRYKIILIILLVIILLTLGFLRDRTVDKKIDNIDKNEINQNEEKIIKINGGVNKDYYGYIKENKYLFEIILECCDGLTDKANIDNVELDKIVDKSFEINIKEDNEIKNNEIKIINAYTKEDTIYRSAGRINGEIIIYRVDKGITDEDFQIISKTNITSKYININKCTIEDLIKIDKITQTKAKAIIEYREKNGKFNSIEEIKNVSGIGDTIYEAIKNQICVE